MFLKNLFKRDEQFFDLLEASAGDAKSSVQLLVKMLQNKEVPASLEDFAETRRKDKRVKEEITKQLCRTFFTPLDREDIESLSIVLSKIPKTVKKFSEKFLLCRERVGVMDFGPQVKIIEQTVDTVFLMVQNLRKRTNLEKMKELNHSLHVLEGDADKLMLDLLREIYSGKYEPLRVIALKDLYEMLEKIVDRCRDAGNVVFQIVLKSS